MRDFLDKKPILTESSSKMKLVSLDPNELKPKMFRPYEHLFFKRIYYEGTPSFVRGGQVEVPTGYTVLSIQNFIERSGRCYGSETRGVDIWFTNTVSVEVKPVHNDAADCYEYTEPGEVILLSEQPKVLQRTQE